MLAHPSAYPWRYGSGNPERFTLGGGGSALRGKGAAAGGIAGGGGAYGAVAHPASRIATPIDHRIARALPPFASCAAPVSVLTAGGIAQLPRRCAQGDDECAALTNVKAGSAMLAE